VYRVPGRDRGRSSFSESHGEGCRFIVVGDRTAGDEVTYPDIDLELKTGPDGVKGFRRKDGTLYPRVNRD
jgi:uncharacterized cupin superfamily protein